MPEIKDVLDLELSDVQQRLMESLGNVYGESPDILYHYTTTEGLIGIISSDSLWSSNASFLNDESELIYATDTIDKVVEYKKDEYNNEDFLKVLDNVINVYEGGLEVYILCFSEVGDLLSQWRAYGDGGNGYVIGLQAEELLSLKPSSTFTNVAIRQVEYLRDKQIEIVAHALDEIYKSFNKINSLASNQEEKEVVLDRFAHVISWLFADFTLWFKHPAFSEEKEWRIVIQLSPHRDEQFYQKNIEFRTSCGRLIPYFKLRNLGKKGEELKLPITKVIHGPTLNPDLTKRSLGLLLHKYQYNDVVIDGSWAPLRL